MRTALIAGFIAAFVGLGVAQAQTPDAAIAIRKAGMDLVIANVGAAKRAMDAKADLKPLKGGADAVAAWAKVYPALFVPGSDKGDTKVKPEALTDHDGLATRAKALETAATKLAAAADANDPAAFATAFGEVGAACGGCHRAYRLP